jgi:hypothetical protein
MKKTVTEYEQFDATVRKVLSISHDELIRREQEWKRKHAKKKLAKASPASRASGGKD